MKNTTSYFKLFRKGVLMPALRSLYIARDKKGLVHLYPRKPYKSKRREGWFLRKEHAFLEDSIVYLGTCRDTFEGVRWEDKEPWRIREVSLFQIGGNYDGDYIYSEKDQIGQWRADEDFIDKELQKC